MNRLKSNLPFFVLFTLALFIPEPLQAQTIFTDRPSFLAALSGSVTDDYSNPGYKFIQTDAAMTAVLDETQYQSTGFPNRNIVELGTYCAGCNGSFNLSFDQTSVSSPKGVYGVAFDYSNSVASPFVAYVLFGDGSSQNFPLGSIPGSEPGLFWGLTSNSLISSIALGLPNGQSTTTGYFEIDNLTVGAPGPLPIIGALSAYRWSRKLRQRTRLGHHASKS